MTKNPDAWLGKMFMEAMPRVGAGILGAMLLFNSALSLVSNRFLFVENPGEPLLYGINAVISTVGMMSIAFAAAGPELFNDNLPDQTA